jgi:hypothetical protein
VSFDLQPLDAHDWHTPVGVPTSGGPFALDQDGLFDAAFATVTVPPEANPISGTELVMTPALHLTERAPLACGDVTGEVTQPIMLDLSGSTFTLQPITDPGNYPTPLIDCTGEPAPPP